MGVFMCTCGGLYSICMQMYTLHLYSGQLTLTTPPLHQTAKKFIICPHEHSAGHHGPMRDLLVGSIGSWDVYFR